MHSYRITVVWYTIGSNIWISQFYIRRRTLHWNTPSRVVELHIGRTYLRWYIEAIKYVLCIMHTSSSWARSRFYVQRFYTFEIYVQSTSRVPFWLCTFFILSSLHTRKCLKCHDLLWIIFDLNYALWHGSVASVESGGSEQDNYTSLDILYCRR